MANKVISIKIDEKDIERLKKYYEALISAGYFTAHNTSMNAFYKHLLLDFLGEDLRKAIAIYSKHGINPKCIDPIYFDKEEGIKLFNTYGFSEESFEIYKNCAKEELIREVERMKENAATLTGLTKTNIAVSDGLFQELEYVPDIDMDEKVDTFWSDKMIERIDMLEKCSEGNDIDADIEMIEKSSMSEEHREKVRSELLEYKKKVENNRTIKHGTRVIK